MHEIDCTKAIAVHQAWTARHATMQMSQIKLRYPCPTWPPWWRDIYLDDALEELESTSNVPRTCRRSMTSARCRLAACPWAPRPPGRPPAGLAAPTCPLLPPPFTPRPIQASSTASDHGGGAWLEFQSDVHEVERQEKPPRHLFARSEHHVVNWYQIRA